MMKKSIIFLTPILFICVFLVIPSDVHADACADGCVESYVGDDAKINQCIVDICGGTGGTVGTPSDGLVPCSQEYDPATGDFKAGTKCDYTALITGINNIIKYFLYLSTFIAIAMFTYAGFSYFMAAGNPSKTTDAKKMITTTLVGILIVYSAWLAVYIILDKLLTNPAIDNPLKDDPVPSNP